MYVSDTMVYSSHVDMQYCHVQNGDLGAVLADGMGRDWAQNCRTNSGSGEFVMLRRFGFR